MVSEVDIVVSGVDILTKVCVKTVLSHTVRKEGFHEDDSAEYQFVLRQLRKNVFKRRRLHLFDGSNEGVNTLVQISGNLVIIGDFSSIFLGLDEKM